MEVSKDISSICYTGHRPKDLPGKYDESHPANQWLKQALDEVNQKLYKDGARRYISGMALGVDTYGIESARDMGYSDVELVAAVPFMGQESRWPKTSRDRYQALLQETQEIIDVSQDPEYGTEVDKNDFPTVVKAMHNRNAWMVAHADVVVAVWTGKQNGGTYDCIRRAHRANRKVIIINPQTQTITYP